MLIVGRVCIRISSREFESMDVNIEIPDDVIERYARHNLDLLTREEATEYVTDNPPDGDENG